MDLLILDEPAASLDAHSEYNVYKQFRSLAEDKTVVMVSHRLGSARLADNIMFLKDGQLVESGHHDQLIESDGYYADLFNIQAKWYRDSEEDLHHEAK